MFFWIETSGYGYTPVAASATMQQPQDATQSWKYGYYGEKKICFLFDRIKTKGGKVMGYGCKIRHRLILSVGFPRKNKGNSRPFSVSVMIFLNGENRWKLALFYLLELFEDENNHFDTLYWGRKMIYTFD